MGKARERSLTAYGDRGIQCRGESENPAIKTPEKTWVTRVLGVHRCQTGRSSSRPRNIWPMA